MEKIHAKWGFGDAPLKPEHRAKTEGAIRIVVDLLKSLPEPPALEHLEAISHVKGQFTRTIKQDQWDWATVWRLLGRPSRQPANGISKTLGALRMALKVGDRSNAERCAAELRRTDILRYLNTFVAGGGELSQQLGTSGFIYILSTRSQPRLLKIGITQRTVEVRVKEINSATGVVVPYGVRASWRVDNASEVEQEVHALFEPFRIRVDREFFEVEFLEASRIINDYLAARRGRRKQGRPLVVGPRDAKLRLRDEA
jgi:hypothetical protein